MGTVRIAQAQINTTVGDFDGNTKLIIRRIQKAREVGADIVTFPELALCGYPPEDLLLRSGFLQDNLKYLERIRSHSEDITAIVGFADRWDGNTYNAAAVMTNTETIAVYHKIELPNYGVFDEKRYFSPDTRCFSFSMRGVRFALTICEDIWIPGSITARCALVNDADVVINISASPFHAGKMEVRKQIVSTFALATQCVVCFNNLVGGQDELVFDGGSLVVDAFGSITASAKRFEEDLLLADIEVSRKSLHEGGLSPTFPRDLSGNPAKRASLQPRMEPELSEIEEIHQALLLGLRDYTRKNGFEKVVVGLSGGIDSALTATLAVQAIGPDNVVGVTMPSQYTSDDTLSDAQLVAENLGIEFLSVPLKDMFSAYLSALDEVLGPEPLGVTAENLQARIRGNILMALSNRFGWLALTTGNKSETAVGYATLYGDMAGGFAVIKDVPKTLVYELAEYINSKASRPLIPESTIERAPTAELRPNQKDQDTLPPYSTLDSILKMYVEEDKSPDEIIGYDPALVLDVIRMVDRSEYKRRQGPPGIKITPKSFGRDRRLPITNRYLSGKKN